MNSYFRNWSKHLARANKKELSEVFPVSVDGLKDRISIKFEQPMGIKIEFTLNKEDSERFIMQVNRLLNK